MAPDPAPGPLNGVRILDFTHVWAGPLSTRILGDLGAEVIKVEAPWARGFATPEPTSATTSAVADHWNHQGVANKLNRNKLGLCLNSKAPEGKQALLDLVAVSDVVIENFSANAMTSMGLHYEVLQAANPKIIYVAMPGFGVSGPYRDFVAFGPSVEPMSGLTSIMGYGPDEPRVTAMAVPDAAAGVTAATAVVTALRQRDETGQGGFIELALHEAAIALFGEYILLEQLEALPERMGNAHDARAPHGVYRCAGEDDWIAIAITDGGQWRALAAFAGEGWERDPRFGTLADRLAHREDLDACVEAWTLRFGKLALMAQLQAAGVPAGALMVVPEILADPHVKERGYFVELGDDEIPLKPFPGLPIRINGARHQQYRRAPKLGEHNRDVLRDILGMDDDAITALENKGVLLQKPPAPRT